MKLRARNDLVFVRPDRNPEQTASGLHIVHEKQHSTMRGTVLALGDGPIGKGKRLPHVVDKGDRVIFSADVGEELVFEKETVICLRETDILAVIEES